MLLFSHIAHHTCMCINTYVSNQKFRKIKPRESFLRNFSSYIFKLQRTSLSHLLWCVLARVFHLLSDKNSDFLSHFHYVSLCSLRPCLIKVLDLWNDRNCTIKDRWELFTLDKYFFKHWGLMCFFLPSTWCLGFRTESSTETYSQCKLLCANPLVLAHKRNLKSWSVSADFKSQVGALDKLSRFSSYEFI